MSLSPREEAVLRLLKEDVAYKNYFFKKVADLKWFDELKREGYFDPKDAPGLQPADQEGFYSIPWWIVLNYLEKVSEQAILPGNKKYIDDLLQIIKDVSNYTDPSGQHIDNYHTWRIFVKILLNIPKEKISIEVIDLIQVWLDSRFNISVVGSEIGLKILPKFLSEQPSEGDIANAEKIIDYITDIKLIELDEEKAKLYNKKKKYKLNIDEYWVKKVFEKHAKDIGEKCTNDVIDSLCEKIHSLLKRDVSLIPLEASDKPYLLALSSEDGKYSVKLFDMGEKPESDAYEYVFRKENLKKPALKELSIDETALGDFTSKVFNVLVKDEHLKDIDTKKLKRDIHNLYCNFHDSETYTSFYNESRQHLTEPLEVLTFVLKSILEARARKHDKETKEILTRFFDDNYLYFPKMALYIVGNNIEIYSDVFWEAIEKDTDNLVFGEIYFGDELRYVLENLSDLSPAQKDKLIEKINQGPGYISEEDPEVHIAKWKQERCQALVRFPEFNKLHDDFKSQTGMNVGLRPAIGEVITRWGEGPSPLTEEDLLNMLTTKKLPLFLQDFKSKGFWEGPTVGGLARLIKSCAAEQPDKFIDNLLQFINAGFIYVYEILDGIREAWNKKRDIAWGKLLEFVHQYINREDFWKDEFIVEKDDDWLGGANHFWIIGVVTDLIREGTINDSWACDGKYLKKAEEILFLIFDNMEDEEEEDNRIKGDYVHHALNSSHGKTLSAFISLALRKAQINGKKDDKTSVKWSDEVKEEYDEQLDNKIIESYTYLGRYLPNLFYLDKTWTEKKVKDLYPESANRYWEAFMDGYISIGTVYGDLYELMIPHYEFGMSYEFKGRNDNEHLVQHIALGYLLGFGKENIDNPESLFRKVLDNGTSGQLLDIISLFWRQQKYIGDEKDESRVIVEKIISFWKWVYDHKYADTTDLNLTDDDRKILSTILKLTVFLPCINEEYSKWIMLAAPYANENYNSSFFIECLDKFDDLESLSYVGKIFLKMLEYFITDFPSEHILLIVEKLYLNDQKKIADKICDIYGKNQYDFLRDLWEKYNKF